MRIPESKISEIASAADIVKVISGYVDLKRAGKDYRGLCPFHGDKDPSFYVSPQKAIFYCFGCSAGGSVFNFVMKMEQVSFSEAVSRLAQRYGVPLQLDKYSERTSDERDPIFQALTLAQVFFAKQLEQNASVQEYLVNRGVSKEWMRLLGLGFAPDSWEAIHDFLHGQGVLERISMAAGLLRQRPTGGYYDYFRSRVMMPIADLNSRIVAFGGRVFGDGDPKYLNSPESPVFRKKNTLYGLDSARESIRRESFVLLVEGYFDQISLRIRGIENVVAPLGTSLAVEQIKLLMRFTDRVTTVFDGDEAGVRAVKRSIPLFLSEGIDPKCLILREYKDPDEAIIKMGVENFRTLLDGAENMTDFLLRHVRENHDLNTIRGRNQALEECLPVAREIAPTKEGDYFIERMSSSLKIREERIRSILNSSKITRPHPDSGHARSGSSIFDFPAAERNVIRGMLLWEGFIDRVIEDGALEEIEDVTLSSIGSKIVEFRNALGDFDSVRFLNSLEDETIASVVAGWLNPRPEEDDLRPEVDGKAAVHEALESLRRRRVERRKNEIIEKMNRSDPDGREYSSLAQELWAVGRQLRK